MSAQTDPEIVEEIATEDATEVADDEVVPDPDQGRDEPESDAGPNEDAAPGDDDAEPAAAKGSSRRVRELEREGEIAADYLETLLDIADLDGDLEVDIDGDRAAVAIIDSEDGPVSRRLVGPGAQVLEALQELSRLSVQAETGDRSRLMLDVAGYRADRRASLVELATSVAERVKEGGTKEELEAMTAFERKVVHDAVLAAGLSSHSEGEEPHRYVVVTPVG